MVHWAWILIALMAGAAGGMILLAYLEVSRHEDEKKRWWEDG